jgi:hypothetical protein
MEAGGMTQPATATPIEEFYTPREIALALKMNPSSVQRIFRNMPGVVRVCGSERSLMKRRQRAPKITLRVPKSVYERWLSTGGSELK